MRIWVHVPGVHCVPESAVTARFRELSFDVTVHDLHGKDFYFAVRRRGAAFRHGGRAEAPSHR